MKFSRATENSYFGFQIETRLLSGHLKRNACNSINIILNKNKTVYFEWNKLFRITFDEGLVSHFLPFSLKKF